MLQICKYNTINVLTKPYKILSFSKRQNWPTKRRMKACTSKMFDANDSSMNGTSVLHLYAFQMVYRSRHQTLVIDTLKGEVHSRMAIYFLYANKKFLQKYVIHQNFSSQRALNPYEIFL